jgi:hypothetical protein
VRFLLDECLPSWLAKRFRERGWDVLDVRPEFCGCSDLELLGLASNEGRVFVTLDRGGPAQAMTKSLQVPGIIVSDLCSLELLADVIVDNAPLEHCCLWLVNKGKLRRSMLTGAGVAPCNCPASRCWTCRLSCRGRT